MVQVSKKFTFLKKMSEIFFLKIFQKLDRYFTISLEKKTDKFIIKSFQRRYLPEKVSGKIDQKPLNISHFLASK